MGRRAKIDKLPPELHTAAIDCIRAHRHLTINEIVRVFEERGFPKISRSAIQRFLPGLDKKDALCANPNEGTIVMIVERGTGEVRTVKSSASGLAIEAMIKKLTLRDALS